MDALYRKCYVLSFCIAAVVMAGCGGSQDLAGQPSRVYSIASRAIVHSDTTSSEVLQTRHLYYVACAPSGSSEQGWFKVRGMATGKFPGSFTAHGFIRSAFPSNRHGTWSYDSTFTIKAGSQTIKGRVKGSGSGGAGQQGCLPFETDELKYAFGSRKGKASVEIIPYPQHFLEVLYNV